MAQFTKRTTNEPSLASTVGNARQVISGLFSDSALNAGDPVYIASDGNLALCDAAHVLYFVGFAARSCPAACSPVSAFKSCQLYWAPDSGTGLPTPGSLVYIGATAGQLVDTPANDGDPAIGIFLTDGVLLVY